MSVGEICNREVVTASRDTTVAEAARLMRTHHTGSLVVVDGDEGAMTPLGIITDRDIVIEVIAKDVGLVDLTVADIMCAELLTAREEDGIWETILRMRAMGVRRMPVVTNEDHFLSGILSMDDLLAFLASELSDLATLIKRETRREAETRPAE